jgi:hypothetical protein
MRIGRKAFIISFDAILALFVVFAFLVSSFTLFSNVEETASSNAFLQDYSFDALKVLESSGKLQESVVSNDASAASSFLNRLPNYYCARLGFFEEGSQTAMFSASRPSCSDVPENAFLARRFFFADYNGLRVYYIAELRAWLSG